jgi:single-stranded-DNA-specific exonuclease
LTDGAARIDAIAFNAVRDGISACVERAAGAPLNVAARLEINRWQGREAVQLRVVDVAEAR